MFKKRKIRHPKIPLTVQEFDALIQDRQYSAIHLHTVIQLDQIAIIFGLVHMSDSLKEITNIQYDATFKVVPTFYHFHEHQSIYFACTAF